LAVVLALLAKVALLALIGSVSTRWMLLAIFAAHVVSRTWPLLLIRLMPHVGDAAGSKSKPLADQISGRSLLAASLWCFSALALVYLAQTAMHLGARAVWCGLDWLPLTVAVLASGLAWAYVGRLLWRRLQGFTGDGLGATQQVCELDFYLGLAVTL
ncbi:MAG: adenosylcobinamide-GDP ribazoletransferase, partial [Rhodoferax sp.]